MIEVWDSFVELANVLILKNLVLSCIEEIILGACTLKIVQVIQSSTFCILVVLCFMFPAIITGSGEDHRLFSSQTYPLHCITQLVGKSPFAHGQYFYTLLCQTSDGLHRNHSQYEQQDKLLTQLVTK